MSDAKNLFKVTNSHLHVVANAATEASQAAEKQWPEWRYPYDGSPMIRVEYVEEAKQYPHGPTTWLLLP